MVARTAAFFDLDKTIIARSSSLAFSRPFYRGGLINRSAMLRSAYAQFVYVLGGADHDQMEKMRASMSELVTGWDVERVKEIVAETLHDLIDPMIYDEAAALIEQHKAEGRDIVIVSSSGTEVVEPIGELLGADDVVATRMVVADGRYTGEIEFYAYAENKSVAMRELAERHGYDLAECYAYSDSFTDLPMLDAVGHPFAVNPDKQLRKVATERGLGDPAVLHPGGFAAQAAAAESAHGRHVGRGRCGRRRARLVLDPPRARRLIGMTYSGGPLTTETLDEGHGERRRIGPPRWAIASAVVIVAAAVVVAFLVYDRAEDTAEPQPVTGADAFISAVRAEEMRADHQDTIVSMRFENMPGGWRMVDIVGLPAGVSYLGPESRLVPADGDLDVSFRWVDISCSAASPGYVALDVQLARPDEAIASATVLVDAADAFDRALERACFRVDPETTRR